jgi:hypothetical protein
MAKKPKVKPTYLTGNKSLNVALHDVMTALQMIEEHGYTEKFRKAAKKNKALMIVPADTVNFVKDFLVANNMHDDPIGKHIVNAQKKKAPPGAEALGAAADSFDCNFGH